MMSSGHGSVMAATIHGLLWMSMVLLMYVGRIGRATRMLWYTESQKNTTATKEALTFVGWSFF